MFRKPPLRTYNKKNNVKLNYSTLEKPINKLLQAKEMEETTKENKFNDTLEDPFDTTFDRLLKEVKSLPPLPPPKAGLSYINSSLDLSDNFSSSKFLTPDSDEDSDFDLKISVPSKKPRIYKNDLILKEFKQKESKKPRLIKKKPLKSDGEESKGKRSTFEINTKPSKKKTNQKKLKVRAKRKRRVISSDSETTNSLCDSVLSEINNVPQCSSKNNPCVNSISETFSENVSLSQTPNSTNSSKKLDDGDNLKEVENISQQISKVKSPGGNSKDYPSEESVHSKRSFQSNKTDSIIGSKVVSDVSLKACSVVLKQCDWMLKKSARKKKFVKLKPCLIKVLRLHIDSDVHAKSVKEPETVPENDSRRVFNPKGNNSNRKSVAKMNNETVKNCVVNLTRIKPLKILLTEKLVSSTPFVTRPNENFISGELSPITFNLSKITSPSKNIETPSPTIQSKDMNKSEMNNCKNNITPKPSEFNSGRWNYSSEYSEIDWTASSIKGSFIKNQDNKTLESFSRVTEKKSVHHEDLYKDSVVNKNSNHLLKPFTFVTERNLDLNPEYEKSMSMFDDTSISVQNSTPILKKSSPLAIDKRNLTNSPPVEKILSGEEASFKNLTISAQSDFKGFEDQLMAVPYMQKLSPMTSVPSSILNSLSSNDLKKNLAQSFILENKNDTSVQSVALKKMKASDLKSPRKCLNFDEESKNSLQNALDVYVSKDKESFRIENTILESEKKIDNNLKFEDFKMISFLDVEDSLSCLKSKTSLLELENRSRQSSNSANGRQETLGQKVEELFPEQSPEEIPEIKKKASETQAVKFSEIKMKDYAVASNGLRDSIRITHRRKKYKNCGWQLTAITENEGRSSNEFEIRTSTQEDNGQVKDMMVDVEAEEVNADSPCDTVSVDSIGSLNIGKNVEIQEQPLFLKPGKSWARSLSILNNIHSKDDMEKLSVGKGKKWRKSVISILDMQSKGLVQSCVRQQEEPKSPQSCPGVSTGHIDCESKVERFSTFGSISPNRFVKRISIRVVPDVKRIDSIEDTQFLEAYGITSSQISNGLSHRLSSLQNAKTCIEPQKTLLYNVQVEDSVIKTSDLPPLVTAKDIVLERCRQENYLPFDKCYPKKFLQHCRKIGEGVYGEVFLYENGSDTSVIKVIPIEGNALVNGEPQKKFHEILSEIVIAKELHNLRFDGNYNTSSFVEVKSIKCIIGRYPQKLIELWKLYDDEKKSENDCPSMFDKSQLYISLELGHGGQDLEAFVFQNANESYAVFIQTALALAVAEQSLEFEHRDLHWGNILISRSKKSKITYKLGKREITIPSSGMKVAIIDFTLSRMSYKGCCIFNDLSLDPALFTAEGEYQFEIYRLMRDKIGNNWQHFEPFTNVLWLHYTLDKMIKLVRYKKKTTKAHKAAIEKLIELKNEILDYDSAFELVTQSDKFRIVYTGPDSSVIASV